MERYTTKVGMQQVLVNESWLHLFWQQLHSRNPTSVSVADLICKQPSLTHCGYSLPKEGFFEFDEL
jgi:hypothetical protein